MSDSQLEEIRVSIDEANKAIELKDIVLKLSKNPDWQKLIEEHYFKEEASRLVLIKADSNFKTPEDQAEIMSSIDAIGEFRKFLGMVIALGKQAEKAKDNAEEAREEILAEEA